MQPSGRPTAIFLRSRLRPMYLEAHGATNAKGACMRWKRKVAPFRAHPLRSPLSGSRARFEGAHRPSTEAPGNRASVFLSRDAPPVKVRAARPAASTLKRVAFGIRQRRFAQARPRGNRVRSTCEHNTNPARGRDRARRRDPARGSTAERRGAGPAGHRARLREQRGNVRRKHTRPGHARTYN